MNTYTKLHMQSLSISNELVMSAALIENSTSHPGDEVIRKAEASFLCPSQREHVQNEEWRT